MEWMACRPPFLRLQSRVTAGPHNQTNQRPHFFPPAITSLDSGSLEAFPMCGHSHTRTKLVVDSLHSQLSAGATFSVIP
jgi:hypothetical protein